MNEDKPVIAAFIVGAVVGLILGLVIFGLISVADRVDPDLQKIQRQRNAMRLYEEASK